MKLHLRQIGHQASSPFVRLLRERFEMLHPEIRIEEAHVVLERRLEGNPAFCLRTQLVTPGRDVFAEACDRTLHAALRTLINQLETKTASRHRNHAVRGRASQDTTLSATPAAARR